MPVDLLLRWWDLSIDAGDLIALLIGAPSGSVSMFPNLTVASAVLLSSVELTPPRNRMPGVGIRLAPHFYTKDAELEGCFEVIDEIRKSGSWRRWQDRPAVVT